MVTFDQIIFGILIVEVFFSIYAYSKFVGELNGPYKVANKDDLGQVYGGYHYETGINSTCAAITTLFGWLIQLFILAWISFQLESIFPYLSFVYWMLIEDVIYGAFLIFLTAFARDMAKDNEKEAKRLNQELGYE